MSDHVEDSADSNQTNDVPVRDHKSFEFGFGFEIENIKTMTYDELVYSQPCIVHDLAWKIAVRKNKKKETLGFFLHCEPVSKILDSYWKCYASATLTIVNKKNSLNNLSRDIKHLFCKKEFDWGYSGFHFLNELYASNLALSDSVKFQVSVIADAPEFCDVNEENSEEESSDDSHDESEDPIKTELNDLKREMNSLTTNLSTEIQDLRKALADMNLSPMNSRSEMDVFRSDLKDDFDNMSVSLSTNLLADISSLQIRLRDDFAEMIQELQTVLVAEINSKGGNSRESCSREEKKEVEKRMETADSADVRRKNEVAQVNAVIEETPEDVEEKSRSEVDTVVEESQARRCSQVDAVFERSPENVGEENTTVVDAVAVEMLETAIEDHEIVLPAHGTSVVETENCVDDFEIVSRVEGMNVDGTNSDASSSFEMISEDVSDDRTHQVSEKSAESDLVVDMVEEHFSHENEDGPVTEADRTHLIDAVRDRLIEILLEALKDVMKGDGTSIATDPAKEHQVGRYIMETLRTLGQEVVIAGRLEEAAANESSEEEEQPEDVDS